MFREGGQGVGTQRRVGLGGGDRTFVRLHISGGEVEGLFPRGFGCSFAVSLLSHVCAVLRLMGSDWTAL